VATLAAAGDCTVVTWPSSAVQSGSDDVHHAEGGVEVGVHSSAVAYAAKEVLDLSNESFAVPRPDTAARHGGDVGEIGMLRPGEYGAWPVVRGCSGVLVEQLEFSGSDGIETCVTAGSEDLSTPSELGIPLAMRLSVICPWAPLANSTVSSAVSSLVTWPVSVEVEPPCPMAPSPIAAC
jgi:hypothetical protein